MAERKLAPVRERPEYYEAIEALLAEHWKLEIYIPLMRELRLREPAKVLNSYDDLIRAISENRIQYVDGTFQGQFNSTLSKALKALGAVWKKGAWRLPESKLTPDIRIALSTNASRLADMARAVDRKLERMVPKDIADKMPGLEKLFDTTLYHVNEDFKKTVRGITVEAELTPERKRQIAKQYTDNMKLYIKDWTEKEITKLRKDVQKSTFAGLRYETMIKTIQESYGTSKSKAKFLARQETSLLMTTFKETRYKDAGINEYEWRCVVGSPKHPVRPMHKRLDGKKFTWDNPPIVDESGNRKHPGQDYNCRCTAIPIVRF